MGRQRRGVLGCTNLPVLTHNCDARAGPRHLPSPRGATWATTQGAKAARRGEAPTGDNDTIDQRLHTVQFKPTRHEKFKLPLICSSIGGMAVRDGQCRTKRKLSPQEAQLAEHEQAKVRCTGRVEDIVRSTRLTFFLSLRLPRSCCSSVWTQLVLAATIDAHETASKSYKNEHWYTSPIGLGSKKSVLLAALKSRDPGGSGFITSKQMIEALQAPNFGLDERQALTLLNDFNAQLIDQGAKVPYRNFVRHLRLPDDRPDQSGQDPTIYYQESYLNRVRTHAAQLIEKVTAVNMTPSRSNSTGNMHSSPRERNATVLPAVTPKGPCKDSTLSQRNGASEYAIHATLTLLIRGFVFQIWTGYHLTSTKRENSDEQKPRLASC
ncbi:unnamed protein product [Phytophthora fragariaefolia]|uniref:Unnamed protein product n=1 Tax=Phytophthora fragariaefolia TaxID=1490495 RepID=A0A9W7D291_9STRA|nr:unnamed protein product [Phytophthora fragariaefolia]